MQYILTQEEMDEIKNGHLLAMDNLREQVNSLQRQNNNLCYELERKRKVALNIGTYDFATAKIITSQLAKVRKNRLVGQFGLKVKGYRQRGRGTRKFDDLSYRLDQSLPLDRAEKVAIYVDCK